MFLNRYNDCKKLQQEKGSIHQQLFQICFSPCIQGCFMEAKHKVLEEEFNEKFVAVEKKKNEIIT